MALELIPFGTLEDGAPVRLARVQRGRMSLEVIECGAAVRALCVDGVEVVLGFPALGDYVADRAYQGVVVGRVANRIAGGAFTIDGERFQLTTNEGVNTLHGGRPGFDKRPWRFTELSDDSVALAYPSPDGEEGFPGDLDAEVRFTLTDDALQIVWEAEADRATPVNLTHHLYFNLAGDPFRDLLDHTLMIRADAFTPVRQDLIPTGELAAVEGTPFDLRTPRRLGEVVRTQHPQLAIGGGYDHNWVLSAGPGPALALEAPETGLRLSIDTDQPGVQVYSGQGLKTPFAPFGGIAIEPQNFPDAINQPNFPDAVLRPGKRYRRWAVYRFEGGR